ncbi:MAG: transporter substrate-binding domain-containing protein [Rhodobacter sp.]|nr:transporter substrate-binding domain-containing protein [Rhodobacter sp.]
MLRGLHLVWLAVAALLAPAAALAECEIRYSVQPGDTYYSVAEAHYGDHTRWALIYYANQGAAVGPALMPGKELVIPCIAGMTRPDPTPLRQDDAELKLLTGGDYKPFTDPSLPGQGLVTELVNAALELTPSPVSYSITWENDWSKHLFPMLDEKQFDMGFPWLRPDCESTPGDERCLNFHFSDPLMLMPIMLFVRTDNQFRFRGDADVVGRSLCRPKGYFTHDLDRAGRRWLSERKIAFVTGDSPRDCFRRVAEGEVDAATVNLFLGANVILEMGLRNRVVPLERPLSEEGLHVVISKRHWRGTAHLYRINAGLKRLHAEGRYQEIVARHLDNFQALLN